jgi:hypothetical protein
MFQEGSLVGRLDTQERSTVEFTEADLTSSDKFTKGSAKLETATPYKWKGDIRKKNKRKAEKWMRKQKKIKNISHKKENKICVLLNDVV